jgi:hypothetical protein
MKRVWDATARAVAESLESRTLFTVPGLSISQVPLAGGGIELQIVVTAPNDKITVQQTSQGLLVGNNGSSQSFNGSFHSLVVHGASGNNSILLDSSVQIDATLYGGSGKNLLQAGSGDDTLVCIGSKADTLIGGVGNDSFWTDASPKEKIVNLRPDEIAAGNVHRVGSLFPGTTTVSPSAHKTRVPSLAKQLHVRRLPEPITTDGSTYSNFSNHPLFSSAGPFENDIYQGSIGDCYFLATLSAITKVDPWRIRQSVLDMGDGTYLVQFSKGESKVFIRVDGQLPVMPDGQLDYAGTGAGGSIWVAIMEKAYTIFHGPVASYASIDGGWMDQAFTALGATPSDIYAAPTPTALLSQIQQNINAGQAVTLAVNNPADGAPLIGSHAYTVDAVTTDADGNLTGLRLRNPWGIDGAGNDGNNDGYVTVTAQQAYDSMLGVVSASA